MIEPHYYNQDMNIYLSDRGTVREGDVIQNLVDAYDKLHHSFIGKTPADV